MDEVSELVGNKQWRKHRAPFKDSSTLGLLTECFIPWKKEIRFPFPHVHTGRVCRVQCNLKPGYPGRTTIVFGTLKHSSLKINILPFPVGYGRSTHHSLREMTASEL